MNKQSNVFLHPLGRILVLRALITIAPRALTKCQKQSLCNFILLWTLLPWCLVSQLSVTFPWLNKKEVIHSFPMKGRFLASFLSILTQLEFSGRRNSTEETPTLDQHGGKSVWVYICFLAWLLGCFLPFFFFSKRRKKLFHLQSSVIVHHFGNVKVGIQVASHNHIHGQKPREPHGAGHNQP